MMKKVMTVLIALAFVTSSLLIMTSCAKKQVVSEGEGGAGEKGAAAGGEYTKEEKERMARMEELKKQLAQFNTENIYFAFDRSDLTDDSKATLKKKADWLRDNPSYTVRVEGHCDERGTNDYNLALGQRRAHAAKTYLMALGISEGRILTISYGEERPANPGHNEEAWAQNRRDEFTAIGK